MKQYVFYATKEDLIIIFEQIEKYFNIKFVEMGLFDNKTPNIFESLNKIKKLGYTNYGSWISLDHRYMIIEKKGNVEIREIQQRDLSIKYAIDTLKNPETVEISLGGIYMNKENILVAGRLSIVTKAEDPKKIFDYILKKMKSEFVKINGEFVGKNALVA